MPTVYRPSIKRGSRLSSSLYDHSTTPERSIRIDHCLQIPTQLGPPCMSGSCNSSSSVSFRSSFFDLHHSRFKRLGATQKFHGRTWHVTRHPPGFHQAQYCNSCFLELQLRAISGGSFRSLKGCRNEREPQEASRPTADTWCFPVQLLPPASHCSAPRLLCQAS